MIQSTTTFSGGLVRKNDLVPANGEKRAFIGLTLALNYSERQEDGTYKDIHTKYVPCVAFGKLAENIANSDIPLGTRLHATGRLVGRIVPAYTNSTTGQTVPEHSEEQLILDNLSPDLSIGSTTITVNRSKGDSSNNSSAPSQQKEDTSFTNSSNNGFGNDFVETKQSNSANDDPFADLFN